MENKKVGYLLIGAVVLLVIVIFMFNNALRDIVNTSCSMAGHGESCPMYDTISKQTNLSLVIAALVFLVALFLIFSKPQKEIIVKKIKGRAKRKSYDTSKLKQEEKRVFIIVKENKAIFQADLIEKTGFGKAKMTRILDRLEGMNMVERKRRGMTNIVVLKDNY